MDKVYEQQFKRARGDAAPSGEKNKHRGTNDCWASLAPARLAGVKGRHAYENLQKLDVLKYSQQTCILPAFEEDGVYGCGPPHRSAQIILHESLVDDAFLSRSMQVVLREARNSPLKIGGPISSPRAERSEKLLRGELL